MPASDWRRRARSVLFAGAVRPAAVLLARLPWGRAQAVGRLLGETASRLSRRDRRRALDHLALAFPELDEAAHEDLGRRSFRHHGTSLAECLHLLGRPAADRLELAYEGVEHLEAARAAGRPILVLTGHCGNWELLGPAFHRLGAPLAAMVRELQDPGLERALTRLRRRWTTVIQRGVPGAARQLLQALRGGTALLMLIVQDTPVDGVWVPFFGRPAYTPIGPAEIALRFDAVVLPAFDEREAGGSHCIRFLPLLDLPGDPLAATAAMTRLIEDQVRRRPEQWVWMHRRWRRQPPYPTQ